MIGKKTRLTSYVGEKEHICLRIRVHSVLQLSNRAETRTSSMGRAAVALEQLSRLVT